MGAIYLVRHGQASFGAADYDRLSETGIEQARVLGEALRPRLPSVEVAVTGAMQRHRQTAEACLAAMGLALEPRAVGGFDEFDHEQVLACYEPRYRDRAALAQDLARAPEPRRAFQEIFARAVARWVGGRHEGEYAEPWRVFRARAQAALEALAPPLGRSKTALVFTSGGPIAAICAGLLGLADERSFELQWVLVNCGLCKVLSGRRGLTLASFNEHGHFEGARAHLLTHR